MGLREDRDRGRRFSLDRAGQRIEQADAFRSRRRTARCAPPSRSESAGIDIDHVAAHPVGAALEIDVVARVLQLGQLAQDAALVDLLARGQVQQPS